MFSIPRHATTTTMFNYIVFISFSIVSLTTVMVTCSNTLKPVLLDVTMQKALSVIEDFAIVKLLVPNGILPTILMSVSPVNKVNILMNLKHPSNCVLLGLLLVDIFPHPTLHTPMDIFNHSMGNIHVCHAIPIDYMLLEVMLSNMMLP